MGEWVVSPRLGPDIRVKRRSDLAPGEAFQEATASAARGIADALAHSPDVAAQIYADMHGLSAALRPHRLGEREYAQVVRAFRRGEYVIFVPRRAPPPIAWGAKVSAAFRQRVIEIGTLLGTNPDYLMACMAFESGETFSPSIRNAAGSGAVGLIQFMKSTAANLGTSTDLLAAMSAEDQLHYVWRYFDRPDFRGKLGTLEDLYMAILWPAAVGKPLDFVLFQRPSIQYRQNAGLDLDGDGKVTKLEASAGVRAKLVKGAKYAG